MSAQKPFINVGIPKNLRVQHINTLNDVDYGESRGRHRSSSHFLLPLLFIAVKIERGRRYVRGMILTTLQRCMRAEWIG